MRADLSVRMNIDPALGGFGFCVRNAETNSDRRACSLRLRRQCKISTHLRQIPGTSNHKGWAVIGGSGSLSTSCTHAADKHKQARSTLIYRRRMGRSIDSQSPRGKKHGKLRDFSRYSSCHMFPRHHLNSPLTARKSLAEVF